MPRRILILIIVVVLLAGGGVWWFIFRNKSEPVNQNINKQLPINQPVVNNSLPDNVVTNNNTNTEVDAKPTDTNVALNSLAMTFAERYGTYSTDAPFQNLKSLGYLLTPSFQKQVNDLIKKGNSTTPGGFYAVTTHALSAEVKNKTENTAEVAVSTQRQESFSREEAPRLSYQAIQVKLEMVNGGWLIDGAVWEK